MVYLKKLGTIMLCIEKKWIKGPELSYLQHLKVMTWWYLLWEFIIQFPADVKTINKINNSAFEMMPWKRIIPFNWTT